jgi:hypothetical protein
MSTASLRSIARHPATVWAAFCLVIACLSAELLAQSGNATADQLAANQRNILITSVAGFLSTLLALGFQAYREERARKDARLAEEEKAKREERQRAWDLEDRRLAREEAKQREANVADKLEVHQKEVVDKIEENTEISRAAFNDRAILNAHIQAIAKRFLGDEHEASVSQEDLIEAKQTLERVESNTKETVELLHGKDSSAG